MALNRLPLAGEVDTAVTHDVFISYSHKDRDWVESILHPRLEAAGLKVLIDAHDFLPNTSFVDSMVEAVRRSRHVIIVLSPDYLDGEYTNFETSLALNDIKQDKPIPVLLRRLRSDQEMPPGLGAKTYVDFTSPSITEREFARLTGALVAAPKAISRVVLLSEVMRRPDVRNDLQYANEILEKAFAQIERVASSKTFHDGLHAVQFDVLPLLRAYQPNEQRRDGLLEARHCLKEVSDQLKNTVKDSEFIASLPHYRKASAEIESAYAEISRELEADQDGDVTAPKNILEKVLKRIPALIDKDLLGAAERLGLEEYSRALVRLRITLARFSIAGETLSQLDREVERTRRLDGEIRRLVPLHNKLQEFEDELRRIMYSAQRDRDSLKTEWSDVETLLDELLPKLEADLVEVLKAIRGNVDVAISTGRSDDAWNHVSRMHRCLSRYFFGVDKMLHSNLKELTKVGKGPDILTLSETLL